MNPNNCELSSTSQLREFLRSQMPITQQYAYFDHAAVSPLPARTAQRIADFLDQATHQGDVRWPEWSAQSERTRDSAARLLGCDRSEIALVQNTTHGIGLIAEGLPWQSGDNVVVPNNEFPSNLVPWRSLARLGVELRMVPVNPGGVVTARDLEPFIDRRTRLVSISWVGFSSGYRCCLSEILDLVHSHHSLLFLDAIQGLGAFPLDVKKFPVDFAAADGHKWMLSPEGAGLLYIRKQHLDLLQPLNVGWNSLASAGFDPKSVELKSTAARYEGGSINMMGTLGLGCSIDLLLELGCNQENNLVTESILENVGELDRQLTSEGFIVERPESVPRRSGIIGIRMETAKGQDEPFYQRARKHLLKQNVVVSVRGGRLRVSTHAYNNREDCQRLLDALLSFHESSRSQL